MRIEHGRVALELHLLAGGKGPSLLLLHDLYGSSGDWDAGAIRWPGPVHALDFSGHGRSNRLRGGAYLPEMFLGDADAALARLGTAAVAGRGLGAYVALLLAGARCEHVPAALLLPGRWLAGGAERPTFQPNVFAAYVGPPSDPPNGTDGRVRVLEIDVRPVDYAARFATAARRLLLCEDGGPRPPWWEGARSSAESVDGEEEAFRRLQTAAGAG